MPKPAKKSANKPKKLDPEQVFIIQTVTREAVADTLNGVIQSEGWDVPEFTPDDPRLTDDVCQAIADGTNEAYCEVDEVVDKEYEYHREYVRTTFTEEPESEDE